MDETPQVWNGELFVEGGPPRAGRSPGTPGVGVGLLQVGHGVGWVRGGYGLGKGSSLVTIRDRTGLELV